jgi:hypothetical protein
LNDKQIVSFLTKQGCRIKPTKSGYMAMTPSGASITWHRFHGGSSIGSYLKLNSRIRQAGLVPMR